MVPIIVPHKTDGGSWRAHAMHCEECRPIYEREKKLDVIILVPLALLLLAVFILAACDLFRKR